jgi:hypothetical protein
MICSSNAAIPDVMPAKSKIPPKLFEDASGFAYAVG